MLSLNVVFRVMDMVLMEGRDVVFKVGLAILESSQHKLVQMDMEDLIKVGEELVDRGRSLWIGGGACG